MDSDELKAVVEKLEPATDEEMIKWSQTALIVMQCGIGGAAVEKLLRVVKRVVVEKRERATLAQILAALGIGPQEKEAGDGRADD